jgi:hypothetical protein
MACEFDFDLNNKIIRCRIDGIVTDETLKEYYKLCSKYGALNPTFAGIFDMSAVIFLAVFYSDDPRTGNAATGHS